MDTAGNGPDVLVGGRYRLGDRLGAGGAAEVFRAVDTRLGRHVAVKRFRPGAADGVDLADEARLLATFSHPGLVTVHDAGADGDGEYLVMQLVEGGTLTDRIARGAMDPATVAAIGATLAGALGHVHARGVMHRDVKPGNVLCGRDGEVLLADFGISRVVDTARRTATGVVVGTASYLAPEQVLGGAVGLPADVYALGLVLLECLKGHREYPGPAVEAALARLHRPPVVPAGTPEPLATVLATMTAADPASRPAAARCADVLRDPSPGARGVGARVLPALPADAAAPSVGSASPDGHATGPGDGVTPVAERSTSPDPLGVGDATSPPAGAIGPVGVAAVPLDGSSRAGSSRDGGPRRARAAGWVAAAAVAVGLAGAFVVLGGGGADGSGTRADADTVSPPAASPTTTATPSPRTTATVPPGPASSAATTGAVPVTRASGTPTTADDKGTDPGSGPASEKKAKTDPKTRPEPKATPEPKGGPGPKGKTGPGGKG